MTSNLKSARQAIEAELAHAQQGAAYYAARVEALEAALQQLESVESDATSAKGASSHATTKMRKAKGVNLGRRRRAAASTNGNGHRSTVNGQAAHDGEAKRGRKPRARTGANRSDGALSTRGDFWLNLVSEQPRSAVDIANAAIETLGIKPDQKEQIQKLKQRVSPALAGLVSSNKIKDSGAGRERRFFKNNQAGSA